MYTIPCASSCCHAHMLRRMPTSQQHETALDRFQHACEHDRGYHRCQQCWLGMISSSSNSLATAISTSRCGILHRIFRTPVPLDAVSNLTCTLYDAVTWTTRKCKLKVQIAFENILHCILTHLTYLTLHSREKRP